MRLALGTTLVVLLLLACAETISVEQQIIATLRDMEDAAENGEHRKFMGYVADEFRAQHGSMERRDFHRFMIFQINQNRRLHAQFFPIHVQESATGLATAHFRLLVTGGGNLLPERGQLFEVETQWIQTGGDWMLNKAEWEAVQLPNR